jgi:hypothetical protein
MVQIGFTQPILAQVNAFLNWSQFLGVGLAGSGIALYALRSMRPKVARDHDIFFAAVALLCGGILFFQGWRQDPILQFGQFLLTGSAIFFAVESIRLRGVATEQAKRNNPIVDEERPVSRVYRADLEEISSYGDRPTRRIRGTGEGRSSTEEAAAARPSRRSPRLEDRSAPSGRRRARPPEDEGDFSPEQRADLPDERLARRSAKTTGRPGSASLSGRSPRRGRPSMDTAASPRDRASRLEEPSASEYVDYRPVDEDENWGDY